MRNAISYTAGTMLIPEDLHQLRGGEILTLTMLCFNSELITIWNDYFCKFHLLILGTSIMTNEGHCERLKTGKNLSVGGLQEQQYHQKMVWEKLQYHDS